MAGGAVQPITLKEGDSFELPKNVLKAPEGKVFKNWIVDGEEFDEGHKLAITKDVEVMANWEDVKVNPTKRALSSLFNKQDKKKLDVGNFNIGNAVIAGDNTTEGDPEGTVTSNDGKTRITNFEAHWVGTDEDTVLGTTLDGTYSHSGGYGSTSIYGKVINHNNAKLQVKYVMSGERAYAPGVIKIKLPYCSRAKDLSESYVEASNIPMPKAKVVDGKIDYNTDYGKAEYIYYIDGDNLIITNIATVPAATSGTFTLDYFFPDTFIEKYSSHGGKTVRNISKDIVDTPDMYKFEINPQISVDVNDEQTIFKNSHKLYYQISKKMLIKVFKSTVGIDKGKKNDETEIFHSENGDDFYADASKYQEVHDWQPEWNDNLKPEKYEDHYYLVYRISPTIQAAYSGFSINFKDIIGKNQGQKIIGYCFDTQYDYSKNIGSKFVPFSLIKEKDSTFTFDRVDPEKYTMYYDGFGVKNMFVLVCFKKDLLSDQKPHRFTNTGEVTAKQLNSNSDPIIRTYTTNQYYKYVPLPPKAEFTAPPGNKFSLSKNIYDKEYKVASKEVIKPADQETPIKLNKGISEGGSVDKSWNLEGVVEAMAETYDPKFGEKDNLDAYSKKSYTAELIDDYLYTGNDYKRELTSDDYEINSAVLRINPYAYNRISRNEIGYRSIRDFDMPISVCARKASTGKWEPLCSFVFSAKSGTDRYGNYSIDSSVSSFKSDNNVSYSLRRDYWSIVYINNIPQGYTSIKYSVKTNIPKVEMGMQINATVKPSDYIKETFKQNETSPGNSTLMIRNDGTLRVINNDGQTIGIPSASKRDENNSRTLDLDLENYGQEMYHDTAYWDIALKTPEKKQFKQKLTKIINKGYLTEIDSRRVKYENGEIYNDEIEKNFIVPTTVRLAEKVKNDNGVSLHDYTSGVFYDLLPIGVSGIKNLKIYDATFMQTESSDEAARWALTNRIHYIDKDKTKHDNVLKSLNSTYWYYAQFYLDSNYELIENWQNTGRTLLIAKYDNAKLFIPDRIKNSDKPYLGEEESNLYLSYDMIYPWDSYKDYGGNLYNFVAFESGRGSMESGLPDVPNFEEKTEHHKIANKALKDLNKDNDNKNFLYAMDKTIVSGNTAANTGLTKHIKDSNDPKYSLATKTKEGGQYSYRIRMQSLSGTTTSGLIFYDSIENYNPLKTDEDYGVKRWKGTLENINLSHAKMRGADPKVYVSTLEGLNMQESKDITDTNIWKPYKEGDDLSKVQAIAVDLRHKPDGTEFKLKEEESVNITLNMRAPWNVKEHQIDPEAKALNEIYANTTITTDLNNQSTNKLINTAYTAIELEPVKTEINLNANKKYLNKEGKDIALKGDDFTFELKDAEGKVLQTKTNYKDGNITFDPIKYNSWDVGEHTYKIVEVKGDNPKIAYDSHEEIVKVKVERVGDSKLKATAIYDEDGPNFTNQEKKSASLQIIKKDAETNKLLEGAEYFLRKKNDDNFTPVTLITDSNGESQVIEDLETGTYILKETKAPQNYRLDANEIEFEITDNDLGTLVVKEVEDRLKADMPTTGVGPNKFIIISTTITTLAAGIYVLKKKKLNN